MRRFPILDAVARGMDSAVAASTILRHRPDLVYVNSVAAAAYLRPARWLGRRVILHVHESGAVTSEFLSKTGAAAELVRVHLVACSPSTHRDLTEITGLEPESIELLPSVPDDAEVATRAEETAEMPKPAGQLIVGACGAVEPRKGADLWVEMASSILASSSTDHDVRFVWVGQDDPGARGNLPPAVEFIGQRKNPYSYMSQFDIFTLPSRDDPFPLVVLEAMLLGLPVVAFDVGGVRAQVGDAGIVVPAGDTVAFAGAVRRLLGDEQERVELAVAARQRAQSSFSTKAFSETLNRIVQSAGSGGARVRTH